MTLNEAAFDKAFEAYWDAQPPGTETGLRAAIAAYLEETQAHFSPEKLNTFGLAEAWHYHATKMLELADALKSKENA